MKIKYFPSRWTAKTYLALVRKRENVKWHYEIKCNPDTHLYQIDCNIMKHVREDGSIQ